MKWFSLATSLQFSVKDQIQILTRKGLWISLCPFENCHEWTDFMWLALFFMTFLTSHIVQGVVFALLTIVMNELIYQKLYTDTSFHVNGIIFADLSNLLHNLRINLCPSDNCCDQATLPEVVFRIIPGTKRQRDVKYKLFLLWLESIIWRRSSKTVSIHMNCINVLQIRRFLWGIKHVDVLRIYLDNWSKVVKSLKPVLQTP